LRFQPTELAREFDAIGSEAQKRTGLTSRPSDKRISNPLARPPATEKLRERPSSQAVGGNRRQEGEHSLVFAQVDVRHLLEEADVPAGGGAVVLLRLPESEKEVGLLAVGLRARPSG
jgi:hypothetical protein